MGNFFSDWRAPKASTHKEFVDFVVQAKHRIEEAKKLEQDGGTNNRQQLMTYKKKVIPGHVNQRLAVSSADHIKACKKLEGFLKTKKARQLYGEALTGKGLKGLKQIRQGGKRFDTRMLECVEEFVDTDAHKRLWQQRSEAATLFSNNMDAVNALANEGLGSAGKKRCSFTDDVDTAHQQAVASARLFKLTCLPRANADSVSPTQTELANWLNKAFDAHPELKEFRASSFVDALFGAYPDRIMDLNRELDDLYAQLQAGNHDSDLLTQISNVGHQQAACIERYLRKLALVGQLLADKFPWEEAPFGSIGIAVTCGRDLNRLAQAYLANGSQMLEMHRFATKAQAQVFAIRFEGQAAPEPSSWADAVEQTARSARRQIEAWMKEIAPRAGAGGLTTEQKAFSAWLDDGLAKHPEITGMSAQTKTAGQLLEVLNYRWSALQELDNELRRLTKSRSVGVHDEALLQDLEDVSARVLASIDGYLGAIEALRRLAVVGAADKSLSAGQRKLLTSTSQVLLRLHQRLKAPQGPLMAMRQRALIGEADARQYVDAQTEPLDLLKRPAAPRVHAQADSQRGVEGLPSGELRRPLTQAPRQTLTATWELGSSSGSVISGTSGSDGEWSEEIDKALSDLAEAVGSFDEVPVPLAVTPIPLSAQSPKASPTKGVEAVKPRPTPPKRSKDTADIHPAVQNELDRMEEGLKQTQFQVAPDGRKIPAPTLTDEEVDRMVAELNEELERSFMGRT